MSAEYLSILSPSCTERKGEEATECHICSGDTALQPSCLSTAIQSSPLRHAFSRFHGKDIEQ
ncbi:hypothetical protein BDV18DRAFT_130384 [Aspergillus unguis]